MKEIDDSDIPRRKKERKFIEKRITCPQCDGAKYIRRRPCSRCDGSGKIRVEVDAEEEV